MRPKVHDSLRIQVMIGSADNRDALRALAAEFFPEDTVAGEGNLSRLIRAIAEGELVVVLPPSGETLTAFDTNLEAAVKRLTARLEKINQTTDDELIGDRGLGAVSDDLGVSA